MKPLFFFISALLIGGAIGAQDLTIAPDDLKVEARADGYHLFIRAKPGIASVLLVESFEPTDHQLSTYAFRTLSDNPINGPEKRLLNGEFLKSPHYSLVDSTTEDKPGLGKAYQILIPTKLEFGYKNYPNSRYGLVDLSTLAVKDGQKFWFSVRAFSKSYADYTGTYKDNAFELKSILLQMPAATQNEGKENFSPELEDKFSRISNRALKSTGGQDLIKTLEDILKNIKGENLDLVLVLDSTKSMENNLAELRMNLLKPVEKELARFKTWRIGLVLYRDYMEEYLTRTIAFQSQLSQIQKELDKLSAAGGGDNSEAVWEGLYAGLAQFPWSSDARLAILIGDAPPHDVPRGRVTEEMVKQTAREQKVEVVSIRLPD